MPGGLLYANNSWQRFGAAESNRARDCASLAVSSGYDGASLAFGLGTFRGPASLLWRAVLPG